MKGLVNCNFLPGSARRLELGTVSAEPLSRAYWSQNSGRSAKRLACRARVLLAKVPIALKRAVGLSGPSSSRQSAPILQQWSEQVCRSFEAGQAMSHSDANCAKPRTGFRCRPADPWKLGARSLPDTAASSALVSSPFRPNRKSRACTHKSSLLRAAPSRSA
jgi:hypothetical protein